MKTILFTALLLLNFKVLAKAVPVSIHVWDQEKTWTKDIDGVAEWNASINAFISPDEQEIKLTKESKPYEQFWVNSKSFWGTLASTLRWQYRLVTTSEARLALKKGIVFKARYGVVTAPKELTTEIHYSLM